MAFLMSFIMSFATTIMHYGLIEDFFSIWMKAWLLVFFIALLPIFYFRKLTIFIISKIINSNN
jgi:hypothetical protein